MANPICSCGKTSLINPNAFQIHDKITSTPVPLEDLTIYVELQTRKKGRSVLITNKQGGSGESERPITVNFIEGSDVNGMGGKKYLTSQFTELTTVFDGKTQSNENLGISSIDIDFNSSYAPMVTINFVDLRGSSIFQNDDNITSGDNPYSVFFKLPYPLYTLKIKGYYGQPVEYCLHMTKFTSRFNSQSGNFEITASFIGYTYAMLSDMLLGVLKAIPETILGKKKYKDLQDPAQGGDNTLLTLLELYDKLGQINVESNRILSTDTNYIALTNYTNSLDKLTAIRNNIDILGRAIDIKKDVVNKYDFFIVDYAEDVKTYIDTYITNIASAINDYNTFIGNSDVAPLLIDDFGLHFKTEYIGTTFANVVKNSKDGNEYDNKIVKFVKNNNYPINDEFNEKKITIIDNIEKYKALDNQINNTNNIIETFKERVAQTLRSNVSGNLGFEPTVRNIVRTFTTAVEVYLSCLYDVSLAAGKSVDRYNELKDKFTPNETVDYNSLAQYYPWPTYLEKNDNGISTEKYLGSVGVLENPMNVDEIRFIDDLFNAFIISAQKEKNIDALIREKNTNWYSVNPLDSSLFNDTPPYRRAEFLLPQDLADMVMIRAMTFLGLSNNDLTQDEILNFAQKEGEAILNDITDTKLKDGFINTFKTTESFLTVTGKINGKQQRVVNLSGTTHFYDYIGDEGYIDFYNDNNAKIIPLKKNFFNAEWHTLSGDISKQINSGNLLLSNYQTCFYNQADNERVDLEIKKPYLGNVTFEEDGGTYVKIIEPSEYKSKASNPLISTPQNTNTTMDLTELKKFTPNMAIAGFNSVGGVYGVQQYTSLKYGVPELDADGGLPFRFMFIANSMGDETNKSIATVTFNNAYYNKSNGFGLVYGASDLKANGGTPLAFNTNAYLNINGYLNSVDGVYSQTTATGVAGSTTEYTSLGKHNAYGFNRNLIKEYIKGNKIVTYPYINFQIDYKKVERSNKTAKNLVPISLFGSRLYNQQESKEAKAFLFLHSLPWNGLANSNSGDDDTLFNSSIDVGFEILNIFQRRAGFISVPKLWPAFIGGLIWRNEQSTDPIIFYDEFGATNEKALIPTFTDKDALSAKYIPKKWEYLTSNNNDVNCVMSFSNEYDTDEKNYKPVDRVILTLPEQAKIEFKKAFTDFVAGDFKKVTEVCEIYSETNWLGTYLSAMKSISAGGVLNLPTKDANGQWVVTIDEAKLSNYYKNVNQYSTFSPILDIDNGAINTNDEFKYNICLEFKDGSNAAKIIMDLLIDEMILVNASPHIWVEITSDDKELNKHNIIRKNIEVSTKTLETYLSALSAATNPTGTSSSFTDEKKQTEQNLFGTTDENAIKFMLYKSCKNIYDKWIGDVGNDKIMFQCGGRGPVDYEIAKNRKVSEPKLIDSFRFVTRSFTDIGDDLAINPLPVADYLKNNPNVSFYDAVTHLLSSNNFDFIALPNFINYNNPELLKSVFQPYNYTESINSCGPSFVCVYLGERSKNLDFGKTDASSAYSNDGFDVICDNNNNMRPIPLDFSNNRKTGDEPVTFFNVTFGQQNQNIFKDVTLDQSEFSETAESLKIMDDISTKGAETNKTLAGQNIYNVYSVRSYKVEVEMMGDAMIQPMMYFQLNNIPMFHGAYMITRVKHSIKPNHMSTNFTGVRIRKPETKIFDLNELYMSLVNTMKTTQTNTQTSNKTFGSGTISANCGSFSVPNIVDGATGFEKSKPIRDLVAIVESKGSYDEWNNGTAGSKGKGVTYTPSTMTIAEIRAAQSKTGTDKLFAVGKYQLVPSPDTFGSMVTALGFQPNDIFNAERQEKAGEWLILKGAGYRQGLIAYFGNGSLGTEEDLQKAITDLAREFASFPTYFGNLDGKYLDPIGYNSIQALYAGQGGNLGTSKFCAQDVAKALIQTWKNLNPNKTPKFDYSNLVNRNVGASSTASSAAAAAVTAAAGGNAAAAANDCNTNATKITLNISSTSVIMGDSTVGVLAQVPKGLKDNKIDIGYNCEGKDVAWLNKQLSKDKTVYKNVKTVFVAIGTNDGYATTSTEKEAIKTLNSLIKSKFPNAFLGVVAGTRGWENVKKITEKQQNDYYNQFGLVDAWTSPGNGWTYFWPYDEKDKLLSSYFDDVNKAHNPKNEWFIGLMRSIIYFKDGKQ